MSGNVCAGKSTLASQLQTKAGATLTKSKDLIYEQLPRTARGRRPAQLAGQRLDRETGGRWLAEAVSRRVVIGENFELVVVDAVRIPEQVHFLRQTGLRVTHVHLHASENTLAKRYEGRSTDDELPTYKELSRNWTERHVNELGKLADVVIDTDRCSAEDVYARVIARLHPRPVIAPANIDIIVGGQYGSEGKGNIAHFLAPEYDVLVRVGGPNAGHQVFLGGGQAPYTFRQLPSGALGNPDATLVIGAGAIIGLDVLLKEIADLSLPYEKLIIDERAMIIDKSDVEWEAETLKGAIGSTAQGIGKATARKILGRQPNSDVKLARDIPALSKYIRDSVEYFGHCLSRGTRIMLEGTQGTSLSLHHGH